MAKSKASNEVALLRSLIANPEEDTYRLVYADWLEENGRAERAEFVRVQCALARIAGDDPQRFALAQRENELLTRLRAGFVAELPKVVQKGFQLAFRRGFVDEVRTTATYFVKSSAGLFARHPVRVAELRDISAPALAAFAGLARLSGLGVSNVDRAGLEMIFGSPHLTGLTELRAYWPRDCTTAQVLNLLNSPACANLTTLAMCGAGGLGQFAFAPRFAALTGFRYFDQFTANDVAALAASPKAANLTALALHNHAQAGAGVLPALAASPHLSHLTSLTIDAGRLPEADVEAFADSPHLGNLTDLSLGWAELTKSGWKKLLRSPRLPRLTRVHVHGWDYAVPEAMGLHKLRNANGILWVWVPR